MDPQIPAIIAAVGSTLSAIIGAGAWAYATVASTRAKIAADLGKQNAERLDKMGASVQELAVNTNSIKDALVKAEKGLSDLEGEKRGRADATAEQALRFPSPPPAPVPVTVVSPTPLPVTVLKP